LELLTRKSKRALFYDVVLAAQDLSRAATRPIGGANLPDLPERLEIASSRPMAVDLLATVLNRVAKCAEQHGVQTGLDLTCKRADTFVELCVACQGVPTKQLAEIAESLNTQLGEDPVFAIRSEPDGVRVRFPISLAIPIR
jgi:hypothetical protein